jgi:hypothetical protein
MRAGLLLAEPYFFFSSDRLRQALNLLRITRLPGKGPTWSQLLEKSDQLVSSVILQFRLCLLNTLQSRAGSR